MKLKFILFTLLFVNNLFSQSVNNQFFEDFKKVVSKVKFKDHLYNITQHPHITGTKANEKVRDYLATAMKNAGFEVEIVPYDVYLPEMPGTSKLEIVTPIKQNITNIEKVIEGDIYSLHPNNSQGFNGYSGSGDVIANIIYVNYGTKADFEYLLDKGVELKGKIALARYGGNFRGYKAKFAEAYGCIGLVIFTDPADSGYTKGFEYPEGRYYNESALQRGSLLTKDWSGDPLTPFEPALLMDGKVKVNRLNENEISLPKIPVLPIGYGATQEIFKQMTGKTQVPIKWQGGLPFTYRIEGGDALKLRINVQQKRKIQRIYNVIGTLKGKTNPNEWIIAGCHYDAWTFGAIDPNSGTAMLLSLADTFGALAKEKKYLNRTLKICHWDAEELGLIGSTEWVEQNKKDLQEHAVAYLNADACVAGPDFGASASPVLKNIIFDATKNIKHPDVDKTIFDYWRKENENPTIGNLGGGSDHLPFIAFAGIPSLDMGMKGPYPYHSNYDNYNFYEKQADPKFEYAKTTKDIFGYTVISLSNQEIIPFKLEKYGIDCETHFEALNKKIKELKIDNFTFDALIVLSIKLKEKGKTIDNMVIKNKKNTAIVNKELMKLEQLWLHPEGMTFGKWYQSLYVSSDPFSGYASWIMPGFLYILENKNYNDFKSWETKYANAMNNLLKSFESIEKNYSKF
jgi:N-acetylated-alpha-linked acidic dipeptidase